MRVDYGLVVINHVSIGINLLCTIKLSKMNMSCLLLSTSGGRDTLCKVGPHDIQRSPMLTSDRFFTGHVMEIFFGVTPLRIIP